MNIPELIEDSNRNEKGIVIYRDNRSGRYFYRYFNTKLTVFVYSEVIPTGVLRDLSSEMFLVVLESKGFMYSNPPLVGHLSDYFNDHYKPTNLQTYRRRGNSVRTRNRACLFVCVM